MATPMILDTTEPDPRSHQGYSAVMRDLLVTDATSRFGRPGLFATPHPLPLGATPRTDVEQSGADAAMADLNLAALTAEFIDFRMRVDTNFVRHAEQAATDRARIRQLESLVQEREREITALQRTTRDIQTHNDRIANTLTPVVLSVDPLLNLAKHAPALLALVEG